MTPVDDLKHIAVAIVDHFCLCSKEEPERTNRINEILNTSEFKNIYKFLQALKIMSEKEVNIQNFKLALRLKWDYELFEAYCQDNAEHEECPPYVHSMTKEQFELVKEVLSCQQ